MSEQQDKLSLLLDEYADNEQSRQALDEVERDVNLQRRMFRYQMMGQTLRGELPEQIDTQFSASVMAKINQLDQPSVIGDKSVAPLENRQSVLTWSFFKPFAGPAVAFAVALVAVTMWQSVNLEGNPKLESQQIVTVDEQKIERLAGQLNGGMRWKAKSNTTAFQQRQNAYLVMHTEYSNPIHGLIPQARVAGFDTQQ
jgi:negative regulator of sigma E activity